MTIRMVLPVSGLLVEVDEVGRRRRIGTAHHFAALAERPDSEQGWQSLTGRPSPLEGRRPWPRASESPGEAWLCVFGERVPAGAAVSVLFASAGGAELPGQVTHVGELFWASEVRGMYPYASISVGVTHQTFDLTPFRERTVGNGWFRFDHTDTEPCSG